MYDWELEAVTFFVFYSGFGVPAHLENKLVGIYLQMLKFNLL